MVGQPAPPYAGLDEPLLENRASSPGELAGAWRRYLMGNLASLEQKGIRYVHICVPDRYAITGKAPVAGEHAAESVLQQMDNEPMGRPPCLLDPATYLRQQNEKHTLFWNSDVRWSPWACFMTSQLLCGRLQIDLKQQLLGYPFKEICRTYGEGTMLSQHETEMVREYRFDQCSRRRYANELAQRRAALLAEDSIAWGYDRYGFGTHVVYENKQADATELTVLLFGDGNSGDRRSLLTGMLAETFSEVHFVWSPLMDMMLVDQVKPDIVISQTTQATMARMPPLTFDWRTVAKETLVHLTDTFPAEKDTREGIAKRCGQNDTGSRPDVSNCVLLPAEQYGLEPPVVLQAHGEFSERDTQMHTSEVMMTTVERASVYFTGPAWRVRTARGEEVCRHIGSQEEGSAIRKFTRRRHLPGTTLMFATSAGAHCYYHWMVELLPKLGLLQRQGISLDSIDYFLLRRITGDWQLQTLARFGIGTDRIIETETHPRYQCDRLIHIDINCGINLKMHRFIPLWMKHLFAPDSIGKQRLKLYISRPPGVRRGIDNEAELLPILHDAGFTTLPMEGLSVAEQAALLSRADILMSPHGGALTNMVFCRPGTQVIEIFSRHVYPYYYGLAACCGHRYHAILEDPMEDYPRLVNRRIAQQHANRQHETADACFKVSIPAVQDMLGYLSLD